MSPRFRTSCREATRLIEQRAFQPLSVGVQLGLFWHLRICAACRAYRKHSIAIDRLLVRRRDDAPSVDAASVEQAVLQRISE